MKPRQVQEYLKRLKGLEKFLEMRIENRSKEKAHYYKAELYALQWSIRYIEDTFLEAAEHQAKYFKEMREHE